MGLETELYAPVRDFLERQGYAVNAEAKGCDVTARKGDELIIVELKTRFSLQLVYQAVDRQTLSDSVYVAIGVPKGKSYPPNFKGMRRLCRRLELGLLFVRHGRKGLRVEVVLHPDEVPRRKNRKRRRALIREIDGRIGELNTGGAASGGPRMTLYRQRSVQAAVYLDFLGEASPSELVARGTAPQTQSILAQNHYGWFERVRRGVYRLHPDGKKALESYGEWRAQFEKEWGEG